MAQCAVAARWTTLKGRRLQILGGSPVDCLGLGIDVEPLPRWAQCVCDELVRLGIFPPSKPPNHVLLNEYLPGQGIEAHRDGPLYEPRVAILSFGSHATFQFVHDDVEHKPVASLLVPPRGLLIFCGDAYKRDLHMVTAQSKDDLTVPGLVRLDTNGSSSGLTQTADGRFLPRGRRLSLTVRRTRRPGDPSM